MDFIKGRKDQAAAGSGKAQKAGPRQQAYQNFQPAIEWVHRPTSHVLRLHLPGFEKEDLKVQVDSSGKLAVRGTRQPATSSDGKTSCSRVEQVFHAPGDTDIDRITARFDSGFLTVTMPKKEVPESAGAAVPANRAPPGSGKARKLEDSSMGKLSPPKMRRVAGKEAERGDEGRTVMRGLKEELLDGRLVGRLAEKINENRKVIAVAVVAFSVGFYVSRKLRSNG